MHVGTGVVPSHLPKKRLIQVTFEEEQFINILTCCSKCSGLSGAPTFDPKTLELIDIFSKKNYPTFK
jgi:hypothetical protein